MPIDKRDALDLVDTAAATAREVGRFLASFAGRLPSSAKRGLHDVVTEMDSCAEEMIRERLLEAYPGSTVVGEELGCTGHGSLRWYVDPIDGTFNFAHGIPLYTVSIGVELEGELVGGAIHDPSRDELFTATTEATWVDGVRVTLPDNAMDLPVSLPVVLADIPTPGLDDHDERDLFELLVRTGDLRRIGSSALALAWVAAGRADVALNADVFTWDVHAGKALVLGAGGGFAGVPVEPGGDEPGGFVAWTPRSRVFASEVARRLARVEHLSSLTAHSMGA